MTDMLDQWAASVDGRYIDLDSAPAGAEYQCHDLFLSYGYALGMEPGDGHAPGTGYTDQVWRQYPRHRPGLAKLFARRGPESIRRGDVVFWAAYAGVGGLPHVAIALEDARRDSVLCMTQNPQRSHRERLTLTGVLGVLRPIGDDMSAEDRKAINALAKQVAALTKQVAALPARTADAVLDESVPRHGSPAEVAKLGPKTSLRKLVAKGETLLQRDIYHSSRDDQGRTIPLDPDTPKMP